MVPTVETVSPITVIVTGVDVPEVQGHTKASTVQGAVVVPTLALRTVVTVRVVVERPHSRVGLVHPSTVVTNITPPVVVETVVPLPTPSGSTPSVFPVVVTGETTTGVHTLLTFDTLHDGRHSRTMIIIVVKSLV